MEEIKTMKYAGYFSRIWGMDALSVYQNITQVYDKLFGTKFIESLDFTSNTFLSFKLIEFISEDCKCMLATCSDFSWSYMAHNIDIMLC